MLIKNKFFHLLIIVSLGGILFFYKLGELPLFDPDEGRYAEVAREMGESKDLLLPHFNYELRLKKPPLYYWFVFLSNRFWGINEFSARFPSAFFSLLGVILTYFIGNILYGKSIGIIASLILMTSFEYLVVSRLAITDMTLCFFFLLAIFSFLKYEKDKKDLFLFLFWISLSLSFLTKGPVGLLPLLVIIFYSLFEKRFILLKEIFIRRISFLVIFFIVGLSWYLILVFKFGFSEMFSLFHHETLERFFKGYIHREPFLYFLPVILLGFFPWTSFLFWIKINFLKDRFLIVWFLVVFIFFSLSRSKIPTYIISLFPCLSILLANFWENCFSKKEKNFSKKLNFSLIFLLFLLILSFVGIKIFLKEKYALELNIFYPLIFSLILIFISLIFSFYKRFPFSFLTIFSFTFVFLFLFFSLFSSPLSYLRSTKALVEPVKKEIKDKDIVISYRLPKPSLVFYTRHKIFFLQDFLELLNYLEKKDASLWLIIREEDFSLIREKYNFSFKNKLGKYLLVKLE